MSNLFRHLFQKPPFIKAISGLILFMILLISNLMAQTPEKKWGLGLLGGFSVYAGNYGNSMTNFTIDAIKQNPTGGINLTRYLGRSFDVSLNTSIGSYGYYVNDNIIFKGNMLHGNVNFRYKFNNGYFLAEDVRIAPYLFAGAGASNFTGNKINNSLDYPAIGGLGLKLRLTPSISMSYQATFGYLFNSHYNPQTAQASSGTDQFMLHMLGFGFNLGRLNDEDKDGIADTKDKCAGTPLNVAIDKLGCPIDKDADGVADYLDKCPTIPGNGSVDGCPDVDGDGVMDNLDKCPNVAGVVALDGCPDRDGDGVQDGNDLCPDVKGTVQFSGCPDTDKDGIEDAKDMCPTEMGTVKALGCPDSDNDGVHDGIDKCKDVFGNPEHSGCPDTDHDGVFDDVDACLTLPGIPANNGCPEVKKEVKQLFQKALQGIQFETGKAIIKPVSYPILKAIAKVMKDNPSYKLLIGGHTDNVGEDEMNMTLSKERATAVSNYLISAGVDPMRLSATGYGETKPVDTNDSVKGRTQNRRVEFKVEFLQ